MASYRMNWKNTDTDSGGLFLQQRVVFLPLRDKGVMYVNVKGGTIPSMPESPTP